jgi:AcrR family transcriptional regulator
MATDIVTDRPLRADARRNRERILDAARRTFAADGMQAQMDDVAAKAGVGIGTVYRHFPTKEALLTAIVAEKFAHFTTFALEALQEPEAWPAFVGMLRRSAELQADDAALQQTLLAAPSTVWEAAQAEHPELDVAGAELIARAIAEGGLRADFRVDEIGLVMCGVVATMARGTGDWRRHLEILVDGLRARPPT